MIRKLDIAKSVAKEFDIPLATSKKIFDHIIEVMKVELLKGSDVILHTFLTLSVKDTMGRTVVAPSTGLKSPAKLYKRVKCKFSVGFRKLVKKS